MTNFEKWKDEVLELANHNCEIAVVNGKPKECDCKLCNKCELENGYVYDSVCGLELVKWLYSEYKEPAPKLNKREYYFLALIDRGYLARDKTGTLYWFEHKPYKRNSVWDGSFNYSTFNLMKLTDLFPFIKWEDEEPWGVADLLKLEVEE